MYGWLYGHDAVGQAEAPLPAPAAAAQGMRRPAAERAAELWRGALALEDRSRLWVGEREGYERFLRRACPAPDGVEVEELDAGGLPALRVAPPGGIRDEGVVVVHLHGGGYTMGSAAECAGGGLAVSLAVRLRDAGGRLPDLVHVVSPFADLSISSESANVMPGRDPWFNRDRLRLLAASYLHGSDPEAALVSPVHADMTGLPPLLVHAARDEALADDARRLVTAAEAAGVEATLELVEDTVHSFVLFGFLPEAGAALEQAAARVTDGAARPVP